ncbi:hypothetical protein Daus18300_010735 [Diaporthe australafricana]|uniref:Uncharacterized protein n=1 Tax=Diaporthe australafricana TaxID=127596 RepID=A0ABR3W946_9PEZI
MYEDGTITAYGERDCSPEVLIDEGLSGEQAIYYGPGQVHVIGILDIHRAGMKKDPDFASDAAIQSHLAMELVHQLPSGSQATVPNPFTAPGSWILCPTDEGLRKIAYVSSDVDRSQGIATASVTFNIAVPIADLDPDRTCPYNRIEGGPFTSIKGLAGGPALDPGQTAGGPDSLSSKWTFALCWRMHCSMNAGPFPETVGHARALGEIDPDLEVDEDVE